MRFWGSFRSSWAGGFWIGIGAKQCLDFCYDGGLFGSTPSHEVICNLYVQFICVFWSFSAL